jgi:hypothetical protein
MEHGELLTSWTARIALLWYVLALSVRETRRPNMSRLMWTCGCVSYLLHVACAFQFVHHWSHAEAYAATARQTAEVVGLDWGGGLYANYAFTLLWAGDVCWWWVRPGRYLAQPRSIEWSAQAFLGFMWFNATVVFGRGSTRWVGLAACLFLAVLWYNQRAGDQKS